MHAGRWAAARARAQLRREANLPLQGWTRLASRLGPQPGQARAAEASVGRVNSLVGRLGLRASRTEREGKRQEEEAVTPGPPHRAGWGASSMRVARERDGPPLNAGPQGTSGDRPFRRPDRTARTVESRSNQHPISKNPALLRHALTASRPALPALRHPAIQEPLTLRPYTLDRLPRAKRRLSLTAVDWDNATALLTPASRLPPTARSRVYQHAHALFSLRAVPSQAVVGGGGGPRARGSTVAGEGARAEERAPPRGTPFAVVASIKAVSKIGAERRRVKTRFKAAVRLALTRAARAAPAGGRADGKERRYKDGGVDADRNGVLLADGPETDVALVPDSHYIAHLQSDVFSVPMPELVDAVRGALQSLARQYERGGMGDRRAGGPSRRTL